jgi:hypothetical protein
LERLNNPYAKVCQADGGWAEPSKDLIEKAFYVYGSISSRQMGFVEQNREYEQDCGVP